MKKEELIRYKAGLAALLVSGSMLFSGCVSNYGFEFKRGEDNKYEAYDWSYINNGCIKDCSITEVYNKLTDESKIYITKRYNEKIKVDGSIIFYYQDLLNDTIMFKNTDHENFEVLKETPLFDYVLSLDLVQERYSHEDMKRIFEEIKTVYKFEEDKKLVK